MTNLIVVIVTVTVTIIYSSGSQTVWELRGVSFQVVCPPPKKNFHHRSFELINSEIARKSRLAFSQTFGG